VTLKGQTHDPNTLRAQYIENYLSYRLQIWYAALYRQCRAGAQTIFHESGRGLGHVTPTIFGSTVGYPSDSLASCLHLVEVLQFGSAALIKAVGKVQRSEITGNGFTCDLHTSFFVFGSYI